MSGFDDYIKEEKIIDIYKASKLAFILFVVVGLLFGIPFYILRSPEFKSSWQDILIFVLLLIGGIVLHELIHGLFFGLFAKHKLRSIRFGVLWEYLSPYCHCTEPLKLRHYVVGALMPAFILGLIPAVVSLFNGNLMSLILGVFFISAAASDFMVVWILRKESPDNFVLDHPSEAGCYIYRKIN